MFWKIMFWIYAIIYVLLLGIPSIFMPTNVVFSAHQYLFGLFGILTTILGISYLYAMGWQKKLFSQKANNIILGIFIINTLYYIFAQILSFIEFWNNSSTVYLGQSQSLQQILPFLIIFMIIVRFGIFVLIWIIPIVAYVKYRKNGENFKPTEKPYWKIFAIYMGIAYIITLITLAIKTNFFAEFLSLDFLSIPCYIISIIFLIGYSFNKKILPQTFWKVIAPVYIIADIISYIFPSQAIISIIRLNNNLVLICDVILEIICLYMLIKYAYSNEVYKIEEKEEKL